MTLLQVWDLFHQADKVRDLIRSKIQEESLRTYLFCYSSVYDSISLPYLALMFELETPVVHSIISKMIIGEELMVRVGERVFIDSYSKHPAVLYCL